MRAPSPVRQLAVLGAIAVAGFAGLALRAGVVEAGPGAVRPFHWAAPPDTTDSTRTADSLRAVAALAAGDTTLADSLLAALRASAPVPAPEATPVPAEVPVAAAPADSAAGFTSYGKPIARPRGAAPAPQQVTLAPRLIERGDLSPG